MSPRRGQAVLLALLSLALAIFLVGHALVVQVDFEACFENQAAFLNGDRPYRRVAEMSVGELAWSASRAISADHIVFAVFGLLPLSPFLTAWIVSRDRQSGIFWIVSTLVSATCIAAFTATRSLRSFYDCDLNGVSLGILIAPILYAAINLAAALVLAVLRPHVLDVFDRP